MDMVYSNDEIMIVITVTIKQITLLGVRNYTDSVITGNCGVMQMH